MLPKSGVKKGVASLTKLDFVQDGSIKEFFWWINERQEIYLRRQAGTSWPWTKDPILRDYFFTNVYREQDKVTAWLREMGWRDGKKLSTVMFNMALARFFNWVPTLQFIGYTSNWPLRRRTVERELLKRQKQGHKIFNDAYVIAGTDLKDLNKITGVCNRLDEFWKWKNEIAYELWFDKELTLESAWKLVQGVPGIGPFIAYEIVTDMRHTPMLDQASDIMTWANPGPGARRGLQRIWGHAHVGDRDHQIELMRELLRVAPKHTLLELEMRDIEHSLCEYDKYKRIKLGQGVVRKYRPA
jgi:hypothetical protein